MACCQWANGFPYSPYLIQITVKDQPLTKWSCWTILEKAQSWREVWSSEEPPWTCRASKFQWQHHLEDAVDGSMSQTLRTSNNALLHAFMGKCKHFVPNAYWGWTGHFRTISKNWDKNIRLMVQTCYIGRQVWENDHLSCRFGLRRSHLALNWKSGKGEVGFHWRAVTCIFDVNFSPLETQRFDPCRFYGFKCSIYAYVKVAIPEKGWGFQCN